MMPAEVVKLPKLYRKAQRWRAECAEHPGFAYPPGYRRAGDAERSADRHNAEHHGGTT